MFSETVKSAFWSKVEVRGPDECWPWTASKNRDGYGKFKDNGTVVNASRMALEIHLGRRLWGEIACHTCDNRECCNPTHLYAGSQADNMKDRWARRSNGTKNTLQNARHRAVTI